MAELVESAYEVIAPGPRRVGGTRYDAHMTAVGLREIEDADHDLIFDMMRDPVSVEMAAFTTADPNDRAAFDAWMSRVRNGAGTRSRVVTDHGEFVGTAAAFTMEGDREVSYWIDRRAWGRGIATEALRLLVAEEAGRPLYSRVAVHNSQSIGVLQRVGFVEVARDSGFANGLGREVEEIVFRLDEPTESES